MLFSLVFILLPISNILCSQEYQLLPLRYDRAINYLKQYQHTDFNDLFDNSFKYSMTSDKIYSYISLNANNDTNQCERDFRTILRSTSNRETWAMKTIDAWGKPLPSGVLKGNTFWVGDYDECLKPLYTSTNKSYVSQPINTQYCSLSTGALGQISLVLGLCVPSSCGHEDIINLIDTFLGPTNLTTNNLACSNDPPNGQKGLTNGAIATIVILSILGCLVLLGTIIDLFFTIKSKTSSKRISAINEYDPLEDKFPTERTSLSIARSSNNSTESLLGTPTRPIFLVEFSAIKSLRRIFTIQERSKDKESFPFINGIRVLSLFWVIIGHSFLFNIFYTTNILDVMVWTRNIAMQFIPDAEFSVDTFFLLSGFLTTILFVREVEKEKKLSIRLMFMYYVHRYIRLTPTFLLIVMISINLTPYFGSGPVYPTQQGFEVPQCRSQYWWTSILYVGNLVKPDYMCLPVSWYLHNDMQFHWIAPLTLIPFVMGKKPLAFIMAILFTLVGIGSIAGLLIKYPDLQQSVTLIATTATGQTFYNTVYVRPWCRISPYFIGVLTAYFVINIGRSHRMNKYFLIIGNLISILFILICLFGLYPDNILVPGIDRISFIFYQSLSRTLWAIAIGWIFFLCMTNQCRIINKILSWSIWSPLAKLNYGAYLTHLSMMFMMMMNQRLPFYNQVHIVINHFVAHIFFSYSISILIVIFIETPFFLIEKKLFKR